MTATPSKPRLNERDIRILDLIAEGKTSREIGAELGLKEVAVNDRRIRIRDKIGLPPGKKRLYQWLQENGWEVRRIEWLI